MPKKKTNASITIFADGGSRGNPGPSGIGAVLYNDNGEVIKEISKYIGDATNNAAEYLAVIYALQEALHMKASAVNINVDSQLIARQLKGTYKVKDQSIKKFFDLALNLISMFDKVEIREVPREENNEADGLVNQALNLKSLF